MGPAHNRLTDGNWGNLGQVASVKTCTDTSGPKSDVTYNSHLLPFSLTTGMRYTKYNLFHLINETGFMLTRMVRRRNRLSRG